MAAGCLGRNLSEIPGLENWQRYLHLPPQTSGEAERFFAPRTPHYCAERRYRREEDYDSNKN